VAIDVTYFMVVRFRNIPVRVVGSINSKGSGY